MTRKVSKAKTDAQQAALALQSTATALYVRVSTHSQADEGFSLDAQQERLGAFCVAQGWPVTPEHIYIDAGISGKTTTERPAFQAMMAAAQAGQVQRIVAMKLDRLARNARDFLGIVDDLKAAGCALVLVKESFDTSTPQGKFALTMFSAMAELEASTITERVMSGKVQKAAQGGFNGAPEALGYTYRDGVFAINDGEAATVRDIFARFLAGQSINSIAAALNQVGLATKKGKAFFPMTVRQILANGIYAGVRQWAGVEVGGTHPAIIDTATYEQAHKRLTALKPGVQREATISRRLEQNSRIA